jgi:hypothetical protein
MDLPLLIREKPCKGIPKLEVFPDRKSLISDIPGFPARDVERAGQS